MDVIEIRRRNLLGLLEGFRTIEELAEHYDLVANYLSQIKGGTRNMGNRFARQLEGRMGKPKGWMDQLQYRDPDAAVEQTEALQILASLSEADREAWLKHGRLLSERGPTGAQNPFGHVRRPPRKKTTGGTQ